MTVDELIEKLKEISAQGKGDYQACVDGLLASSIDVNDKYKEIHIMW